MTDDLRGRGTAWLVFALVAAAAYGNFYVYDSIGPVADLLQRERGFSDTQIGMLNAIYSLPNVVLVLVGGLLVDRFGAARMAVGTAAVCLAGSVLTAFSPDFAGMAAGRLLFGIGAETLNIALTVAIVDYFAGRNLAFAMGLNLAISRAGSFSADMSPSWFARRLCAGLAAAAGHRDAACRGVVRRGLRLLVDRSQAACATRVPQAADATPALCCRRPARLRDRLLAPAGAVRALVRGDPRVPQHVLDQVLPARPRPRSRDGRGDEQLRVPRRDVRHAGVRLVVRQDRSLRAHARRSAPCCCRFHSSSWQPPTGACGWRRR